MWSRALRRPLTGARLHRTVRFARKYNGQNQGPHTTYFQQPPQEARPPRRILRTILLATSFTLFGILISPWIIDVEELELLEESEAGGHAFNSLGDMPPEELAYAITAHNADQFARKVPGIDLKLAQMMLERQKGWSIGINYVGHHCYHASNLPCEDVSTGGDYTLFDERGKNWTFYCLFDGHAGPRTAHVLSEVLPTMLGERLYNSGCMSRAYLPNDETVTRTIKSAFKAVDDMMLKEAKESIESSDGELAFKHMIAAPVLSGSCALVALFDPQNSVLRVANTGDSRAVLGHWDSDLGKYVAKPMSIDQTGFNQDEVKRLRQEHPGEDPIDPNTGRVHGLAVTRAFGDARWKWPNEFTQFVHEKLFGPAPRPNGVIKTPPYLTAEPEVMEARVQTGDKPDFLIMGTDGLWDNISSENAVFCVQQWLDKYQPSQLLGSGDESEKLDQKLQKPPFDHSGPPSAVVHLRVPLVLSEECCRALHMLCLSLAPQLESYFEFLAVRLRGHADVRLRLPACLLRAA